LCRLRLVFAPLLEVTKSIDIERVGVLFLLCVVILSFFGLVISLVISLVIRLVFSAKK
jgi:hypothetical protein